MTTHRWSKFWWSDYETDSGLKLCSLAAQGLWMRMLCEMHRNGGELRINGRPMEARQIGALGNISANQATALVAELETNGVFSRRPDGAIYSRRMEKDALAHKAASESGKRGGNPTLKANPIEGDKATLKGPLNPTDKAPLKLDTEADTEAESKKESTEASPLQSAPLEPLPVRDRLWAEGVQFLADITGRPPDACRQILGKLLKTANDDCAKVLRAFDDAREVRPVDPVPWLLKACGKRETVADLWEEYQRTGTLAGVDLPKLRVVK